MPIKDNMVGSDFFLKYVNSDEEAAKLVEDLVSERLPKAYPDMEIQVLTPRRSDIATSADMLNVRLQNAVNPERHLMKWGKIGKGNSERDREFRVNDRVMQMKNDYDLDVLNGDVGKVYSVTPDANSLTVMYGKRRVVYEGKQLNNLSLAYATTVHKSQGSEYDIAVVVMTNSCGNMMLQRNLLYTAITRAAKVCVLVTQKEALRRAVGNWSQEVRNTRLKERL
jgi:exodeoxyribonuclease V alpha subunit